MTPTPMAQTVLTIPKLHVAGRKYVKITKKGQTYHVREGGKSWRQWVMDSYKANPSFQIPTGYYVSGNGRLLQTTIKAPKAPKPKATQVKRDKNWPRIPAEYTVVKHNNRSYRTRVGSTAWRKWIVEQRTADPSFVIPAGWYINKEGDLRKTQQRISYEKKEANEYVTLRYPEMGHYAIRRTFGNLTKKTKSQRNTVETEAHLREQRQEAWQLFSTLTSWQTKKAKKIKVQWQSLEIPTFKYTVDYQVPEDEDDTDPLTDLGTSLSCLSQKAWVEALVYYTLMRANRIKGEKQTSIHLRMRRQNAKSHFTIAFNNAQLASREKIRESVIAEVGKYQYQWLPVEASMMVIQLGETSFAGGCNKDNDHSHNVKQFLPRCRISLNSPKSVNSNCGIMCFIKFLGLKANVVKPDAIRKKLSIPEGDVDHEDMKRIAEYFKVSCEMYIHPIQHEDAYAWRYESPEEGSSLRSEAERRATTIRIHLINGHYEYEHMKRQSYFICVACGAGSSKAKDGRRMLRRCEYDGQNQCKECNPTVKSYYEKKVCGISRTTIKTVAETPLIEPNDVVLFDLETFQPDGYHKSLCYYVGYMKQSWEEPRYFFGENSMRAFVEWATKQNNCTFIAYNGSRYDHYFFVNECIKQAREKKSLISKKNKSN